MDARVSILIGFIGFFYFSFTQTYPCIGQPFSKDSYSLMVKNGGRNSKEGLTSGPDPAIEEYEKVKLAKLKRNIGRRYLTVKTNHPVEFYESPNDLEKKLKIAREKEGFVILEVVQNRLGTMNFYEVKFDSGQTGYLSADGDYLEIKMREGNLIYVRKRASPKKSLEPSEVLASGAVELVKNHPTLSDPATGERISVERRMMEQKAKSFPNMKWSYEAKKIGTNKFGVTQYAGEGAGPPLVRTWIVDLSTTEVQPQNLAAKEMYR